MQTLDGEIFVIHGDLSQLSADAIVVPTSTEAAGDGHVVSAVKERLTGYREHYKQLNEAKLDLGEVRFWAPTDRESARRPCVATVAVTTGTALQPEKLDAVVDGATRSSLDRCAAELRRFGKEYVVVGIPLFNAGQGGHHLRLAKLARAQMKAARDAIHDARARGLVLDVVFVAFSPSVARICRHVRRESSRLSRSSHRWSSRAAHRARTQSPAPRSSITGDIDCTPPERCVFEGCPDIAGNREGACIADAVAGEVAEAQLVHRER